MQKSQSFYLNEYRITPNIDNCSEKTAVPLILDDARTFFCFYIKKCGKKPKL